MEAFFCTNLQAMSVDGLLWVVMRWSVEVPLEEACAQSKAVCHFNRVHSD